MEITLEVEDEIFEAIERRARKKEFESSEEYCEIVIRAVVEELEAESTENDVVEDRLEDLGYLN